MLKSFNFLTTETTKKKKCAIKSCQDKTKMILTRMIRRGHNMKNTVIKTHS